MKRLLVLSLLVNLFLFGCGGPKPQTRPAGRFGYQGETSVERQVPAVETIPVDPQTAPPAPEPSPTPVIEVPEPKPTPAPVVQKQEVLYGIPVPGKPGHVRSPYLPNSGLVDVRGFPPGTEVRCPYSKKIFLVP